MYNVNNRYGMIHVENNYLFDMMTTTKMVTSMTITITITITITTTINNNNAT